MLRRADIDTTGPVWLYRPTVHKLSYRGKSRVIAIGPKAQAVLAEFPTIDPATHVFSAARGMAEIRAHNASVRITPRWPSHLERNKRKRKKSPRKAAADWYTRGSYTQAVAKAVIKANAYRERMAGQGKFEPVPHWHPNQLRHSHATKVRALFGLEAAQVSLGHGIPKDAQAY